MLKPGITHQNQCMVTDQHAATHIGDGQVLVLSTPSMIELMEITATQAVQPYLPDGHTTVGTHVDVRHLAATPLGMKVKVNAELVQVENRILTFRVSADDEKERVGEGSHKRAIINVARFQAKLSAKRLDP